MVFSMIEALRFVTFEVAGRSDSMHGASNVHTTLMILYHIDRYYHAATGDMVKCLYMEKHLVTIFIVFIAQHAIDYFG